MPLDQVATFTINYSGAPFNTPLRENKPFYYALLGGACFFWVLTAEFFPEWNESLQLVPVPPEFRSEIPAVSRAVCNTNVFFFSTRQGFWNWPSVYKISHGSTWR